jgi:hypothetical protein
MMQSRVLLGWAVLMTAYGCAWACGGHTSGDSSSGRDEGTVGGTGGRDSDDSSGGSDSEGSSASDSGDTGDSPGSGGSESGGSGAAPGSGGSAAVAAGGDFIWSGYDLSGVELDESASGTPVPADDPGNAYGYTMVGSDDPGMMLECAMRGFGADTGCMEFVVCLHDCSSDEDCPRVDSGTTNPQCGDPSGLDSCSLPCGDGLICPDGMACVYIDSGFFCFWPSPVWRPGCPGYCAEQNESCDSSTTGDCCEGLVCATWEQCEPGSCLRLSWPCSEDTAPCCEGMACIDDYCT